jgi:hypothetical protein
MLPVTDFELICPLQKFFDEVIMSIWMLQPKREEEYARIDEDGGNFVLDRISMSRSIGK